MAGELILIVEDNPLNLELVRDLLQAKGYRTLEAVTGADGLALAAAHDPDLILMDVQLPDHDGIATLKRLRAQPGLASTRVVAVTAFAMREDRQHLLAAGFDDYVSKPIEIRDVLERVRQLCVRKL